MRQHEIISTIQRHKINIRVGPLFQQTWLALHCDADKLHRGQHDCHRLCAGTQHVSECGQSHAAPPLIML